MAQNLNVLLVCASSMKLNYLEDALAEHSGISSHRKLLTNHANDSGDVPGNPDVIVFETHEEWDSEFNALVNITSTLPLVPFIVIGEQSDTSIMRQAMQAGARDFFIHPVEEAELIDSITTIGREAQLARRSGLGTVTAIINGKGGSGASVIATSLAASIVSGNLKKKSGSAPPKSVLMLDADLQFGSLPVYLDLPSTDNLQRAIQAGSALDNVALENLLLTHNSGIRILSNTMESVAAGSEVFPEDLVRLVESSCRYFDHIILDIPRVLDRSAIALLEVAEQIVIPTTQIVPGIRDTVHLIALLNDLGVSRSTITVIVNRYNKKAEIKLHDMRSSFEGLRLHTLPMDEKHVQFAVNNGVPVPVKWPKCPFSKAVMELSVQLWHEQEKDNRTGFR